MTAAPSMTERQWQTTVEQALTAAGWRWYHAPDNRPGGRTGRIQKVTAGFPDLIAVRGGRLLALELKAQRGRLGPAQQEWLDALALAGAEVAVYKPSDWDALWERIR